MEPAKITYRKNNPQVISLEKGKTPPQAIDLEESVLGIAMQFKNAISDIVEIFRDEPVFYKPQHQLIYDAMLEMFKESEPIDLLSLLQKLKQKSSLEKVGGDMYLIELTTRISSAAHLEHHCRIVLQMYVKRKSIHVANHMIEKAYNEETDIFDLLADSQKDIDDTAQWLIRKKPADFKSHVDNFFDHTKNEVAGVPNKLMKLKGKMNGYRNEDLIIIAARPGMGKTALILNEAKHQAEQGIPVGIFSLEMSAKDLVGRMIAEECEIDYSKIHKNKLNDFEKRLMNEKRKKFEELPIHIHDQAGLTPMEMKIQSSKWKREHGVKILYVDYLQLMNASGKNNSGNREQEISSISRSLKATAKDLGVPVIALSQLSRAVETRGGMKRPMLSDLRESGAIEQDADIVMFLLRPEYYKIDTWDDEERSSTRGQCEINIAKFRGGETAATVVGCDLRYMKFHDLEENFYDDIPEPPAPQPNHNVSEAFEPSQQQSEEDDDELPF